MRLRSAAGICLALQAILATPTSARDSLVCPGTGIRVDFADARDAGLVCAAAAEAETLFGRCGLPAPPDDLRVRLAEDLPDGCVGLYHCGDASIDLLPPAVLATRRDPAAAFGALDADAFFRSVVVHELAHAAIADIPCPIYSCVVSGEYIAYAMQILSLDPGRRPSADMPGQTSADVSYDDLSRMILFLAPDLFARTVAAHLAGQDDPCDFIGRLRDREILLDRERFE